MTLPFYLSTKFLIAFLRVLLIIYALIFLVELVENLRRFSDDGASFGEIAQLTLLRIPDTIGRALPLIILISTIAMFYALARGSEAVIVRSAGVSALRMVFVPVGVAIMLGMATVALFNPIIAATQRQYDVERTELSNTTPSPLSVSEGGLWLRQATGSSKAVIQARRASSDGRQLFNPTFHVFGPNGVLTSRLIAKTATLEGDTWELEDVRVWEENRSPQIVPNLVRRVAREAFPTNLTSEQILDSFAPPETISFWSLPSFIRQLETSGFTATRHRQFYQTTLSTPLLFCAMVMIGAGFTLRHARFGNTGILVMTAVLSGFALYIFRNLANSLGAAGEIPVLIAAWAPPVTAILLATGLLLHLEDG